MKLTSRFTFSQLFKNKALLFRFAMIMALIGSLKHVAWAFNTLEGSPNSFLGYVQAIGLDVGLFSMAEGIVYRKSQGRPTLSLWVGVGIFSLISAYANLLHGVFQSHHLELLNAAFTDGWQKTILYIRPLVLSATLPLLIVYLTEVATAEGEYAAQLDEDEETKTARQTRERFALELQAMPKEKVKFKIIQYVHDRYAGFTNGEVVLADDIKEHFPLPGRRIDKYLREMNNDKLIREGSIIRLKNNK